MACILCTSWARVSTTLLGSGHFFQDQVFGRDNAFSLADDRDGFVLLALPGILVGYLNVTTRSLADSIDGGSSLADDVAVKTGVGENEIAGMLGFFGSFQQCLDLLLGLGHRIPGSILATIDDPRNLASIGTQSILIGDNVPGVLQFSRLVLVSDQGHVTIGISGSSCPATVFGLWGRLLAVVVNANAISRKLTEQGPVLTNNVMQRSWYLDRLAGLFCRDGFNMGLRFGHILWSSGKLDASMSTSLTRDIEGNREVILDLLANGTVCSNKLPMLGYRHFDGLGDLIVSFIDKCLNGSDDAFDDVGGTLDGKSVGFFALSRESNMFSTSTSAAGFGHNALDVGACVSVSGFLTEQTKKDNLPPAPIKAR